MLVFFLLLQRLTDIFRLTGKNRKRGRYRPGTAALGIKLSTPSTNPQMAQMGAMQAEMALVLGCYAATLHLGFADAIKKGSAELDISLRVFVAPR